ncbi:MAG: hypothetical protein ACYDFT_07725 [Thermoplasmata archaeon]
MSPDDPSGAPQLEVGPALMWAAIMLTGIIGIVILSSAWTLGGLPVHWGRGFFHGESSSIPLYVGFALPTLLVLGVGALAVRTRWGPVRPAHPEGVDEASVASVRTGH